MLVIYRLIAVRENENDREESLFVKIMSLISIGQEEEKERNIFL